MLTRNLLRHIFRHGPRVKISEDPMPLRLGKPHTELVGVSADNSSESKAFHNNRDLAISTLSLPPKTPEPFGLENITEEDGTSTPSLIDNTSLTETLASLDLEINTFSTRELVHATIDEAKMATKAHLETIHTTLALLDALNGFSATISELGKEIVENKQRCEENLERLDAVERAVEGMSFAGELQEQNAVKGFRH